LPPRLWRLSIDTEACTCFNKSLQPHRHELPPTMAELLRDLGIDRSKSSKRKREGSRRVLVGKHELGNAQCESQVKRPAELEQAISAEPRNGRYDRAAIGP